MKKLYFLTLIIFLLFSSSSNAKNFRIVCGNWFYEENGERKKMSDGGKIPFNINLDKKIIQIEAWIYADGGRGNSGILDSLNIFKISNKEIRARGKSLDGTFTFDLHYNFVNKSYTGINYKRFNNTLGAGNNTNKIFTIYHALSCNDQHDIKLALTKPIENQPTTKDQNTVVAASSGTGFFVSKNGHMVTNNHVIDSCDSVKVHYKGRELDAKVLFTDRSNDLAIIKANIKPKKVFPVSNEDVSLLEDIIVAGYPLGKNISASVKTFKGSVTALAGFGDNYSNFQIDASLSSGNSGGPIVDQKGNIVGVAVAKYIEEGVEGFNFGVKSSTLKTFASSNQIKFASASTEELSNKELGQLITEATIYLECWMSVAKIKQIIKEGERQKVFFSEYK